jgi:cell division septation protein DedD
MPAAADYNPAMLARALLVLLLVLNVGVAAWWLARSPAPQPPLPSPPEGVARLQLVGEAGRAAPAPAPAAAEPAVCLRLGPYADPGDLQSARLHLQSVAIDATVVREAREPASRWRVMLPPPAGEEDAVALAQRIATAGFDDLQVVAQGPEAGAIALGVFTREDAARAHLDALRAAGFEARLYPDGDDAQWLSVALDAAQAQDLDERHLRASLGALRAEPVPCGPGGG